jgi:hypothetical protein
VVVWSVVCGMAPPLTGAERLRALIWPAVASAPAAVRVEVLIEAHDDNRALEIVVDSGDYYRSSVIALEGARGARYHAVQYRALPAGTYEVQVTLRGPGGATRALQRQRLEIVP